MLEKKSYVVSRSENEIVYKSSLKHDSPLLRVSPIKIPCLNCKLNGLKEHHFLMVNHVPRKLTKYYRTFFPPLTEDAICGYGHDAQSLRVYFKRRGANEEAPSRHQKRRQADQSTWPEVRENAHQKSSGGRLPVDHIEVRKLTKLPYILPPPNIGK